MSNGRMTSKRLDRWYLEADTWKSHRSMSDEDLHLLGLSINFWPTSFMRNISSVKLDYEDGMSNVIYIENLRMKPSSTIVVYRSRST